MDLEAIAERGEHAIIGSIVADAAAMPMHWIYDSDAIQKIVSSVSQPEFLERSANPYYSIPTGRNSCYGDQTVVLLASVAACKGFDESHYKHSLLKHFGPESEYNTERILGHKPSKHDFPIPYPWRNQSVTYFVNKFQNGDLKTGDPTDAQGDCYSKVAPIVAIYAGSTDLLDIIERVVRVTQDNDTAVKCAKAGALVLEQYILNGNVSDVVDHVLPHLEVDEMISHLRKMKSMVNQTHHKVVPQLGSSCLVPGSFLNSLHCVLQSDGDYCSSVRSTMTAGGCNCSRSCFVGACLGALHGVPDKWLNKLCNKDTIVENAKTLANHWKIKQKA